MAPTAPSAILCGDPARALIIAQELLTEPRMSNHHRGLWGYHGRTAGGEELTVHATGIGAPSACAVLSELIGLGVASVVRVGSCRGSRRGPPIGTAVVAERIVGVDGTSTSFGAPAGAALEPDPGLTGALRAAIGTPVRVLSADRYDAPPAAANLNGTAADGGLATVRDLQSAGLAALAGAAGIRFAAALIVAEGMGGRLEDDPLEATALRIARIAAHSLSLISTSS